MMKPVHLTLLCVLMFTLSSSCAYKTLPRAAQRGDSALLQTLLNEGTPVDQKGGKYHETALIVAARKGNMGMVQTLLKAGASVDAKTKHGNTALTAAAYHNYPRIAELLIDEGADVNVRNLWKGSTPLLLCAENGNATTVKALLANGARINEKNIYGATALNVATRKGYTDIVELLLATKAETETNLTGVKSPLYLSALKGRNRILKELVANGADVNAKFLKNGWTPLMIAAAEGHVATTALLLESGADPNIPNRLGRTALMFAAWYRFTDITALLLQHGADPNIVPDDGNGMTALMAATTKGHKEIIGMLLNNGADPNLRDKHGRTASDYEYSASEGYQEGPK